MTNRNFYEGGSRLDILSQANSDRTPRPSNFAQQAIPRELDDLIQQSLSSQPDNRLTSIAEFSQVLTSIALPTRWGQTDAQRWWSANHSTTPCRSE